MKIVSTVVENTVVTEHPDDPKMKFQYVTLLSVGSKEHKRYIEELDEYLKSKKYKY